MASSSAIQLADLALVWDSASNDADLAMIDGDLASDRGLETAFALSLFTDRRAEDDDVPPSGDPNDRGGWWADEFAVVPGDRFGSRLWLLSRAKVTNQTALLAKQYASEAVAWAIEDKVAASIDVTTSIVTLATGKALSISVAGQRPSGPGFSFQYVWDHLQEDM